eukprot:scaffold549_cov174-Ochromonas_danica.AAC.10
MAWRAPVSMISGPDMTSFPTSNVCATLLLMVFLRMTFAIGYVQYTDSSCSLWRNLFKLCISTALSVSLAKLIHVMTSR